MNRNTFRVAAGTLTAAAALVALSACTQAGPAAAPPAHPATGQAPANNPVMGEVPTGPATTQSTPAAPANPARPATVAASKPALKFPGTTDDVIFSGFDVKTGMAEFTKMMPTPGQDWGLVPDPSDPGIHRLPMAPNATVRGFKEDCPPVGTCTADMQMQNLIQSEGNNLTAHIHVNSADQIDSVIESDY